MFFITIIAAILPFVWLWSFDTAFIHSLFIFVGYRFKDYFKSISYKQLLIIVPVYLWMFYINKMPNISISNYGTLGVLSILNYFMLGMLETVAILWFCKVVDKFRASLILKYFGRNSLRLMCIHMGVFTYIDEYSTIPDSFKILLSLFLILILIYFIQFIVTHFGDKNILLKSI